MKHRHPSHYRARRAGLTLVELIISLAIMALIGVTVASMLSAVAYGTDSDRDVRSLIARGKMTTARIDAAICESRSVLSTSQGVLVLWMRDEDGDETVDADEVRRLAFDGDAGTLTSYTAAAMTEADEDAGSGSDLSAALQTGTGPAMAQLVAARWAERVEGWKVSTDDANPVKSRLVNYRLTLRSGGETPTVIGVAALRNVTEEP